jgi:hypothetical protein
MSSRAPVLPLVAQIAGLALVALAVFGITALLAASVVGWWTSAPVLGTFSLYMGDEVTMPADNRLVGRPALRSLLFDTM